MTGREFLFLMIGVLISNVIHPRARTQGEEPSPVRDEERLKGAPARVEPYLFFGWAALTAWFDLYILYRWAFWNDRWETGLFALILGLSAASALFALIGLVLRDEGLPRRMGRMWADVVRGVHAKAPVKPKPARHDLD